MTGKALMVALVVWGLALAPNASTFCGETPAGAANPDNAAGAKIKQKKK